MAKDFETISVSLTETPINYTGTHDNMEIVAFDPDIHDTPGLYLQRVSGCGYDTTELTVGEARKIANALLSAANWLEKQKWKKCKLTAGA